MLLLRGSVLCVCGATCSVLRLLHGHVIGRRPHLHTLAPQPASPTRKKLAQGHAVNAAVQAGEWNVDLAVGTSICRS